MFEGNLNLKSVKTNLNNGTWFSSPFDSDLVWTYLGKDEKTGTQAGQKVEASIDAKSGTWSANFSPTAMNNLIVLLKGSTEYSLFLFKDFLPSPGSSFAGKFDMNKTGIRNAEQKVPGAFAP